MTGGQSFVGAAGAGLVLANFWTGTSRSEVTGIFSSGGNPAGAHKALVALAGEMLFVVVVTLLAGVSKAWESVAIVLLLALWVLWAMNHYGKKNSTQGAHP